MAYSPMISRATSNDRCRSGAAAGFACVTPLIWASRAARIFALALGWKLSIASMMAVSTKSVAIECSVRGSKPLEEGLCPDVIPSSIVRRNHDGRPRGSDVQAMLRPALVARQLGGC